MVTMTNNGQQTIMSKDNNTPAAPAPTATTPPKSDRRSNKPIMEKRRRARINNCLNELKTLILDASKKDPSRHAKLEKADILEKTVKHLQDLQRQQAVMAQVADPKVINKFKAGFVECANEVSRFPGVDPMVKRRLLMHLNSVHNGFKQEYARQQVQQQQQQQQQQQHQHILPSPPSSPEQDHHHIQQTVNGYILPKGLHVYPTKLPNGQIAFLPTNVSPQAPALVPIPSRTASTGSASSHSSGYDGSMHYAPPSPAGSYEGMEMKQSVIQHSAAHAAAIAYQQQQQFYHHQQQQHHLQQQQAQQPISLVVKKMRPQEEDQPWRPW